MVFGWRIIDTWKHIVWSYPHFNIHSNLLYHKIPASYHVSMHSKYLLHDISRVPLGTGPGLPGSSPSFVDMILAAPLAHHRHRKDQGIGDGVGTMVGPDTHRDELAWGTAAPLEVQPPQKNLPRGSSVGYIPGDFSGIGRVNPLITKDITYLLSGMIGMIHQVVIRLTPWPCCIISLQLVIILVHSGNLVSLEVLRLMETSPCLKPWYTLW